MAEGGRFFKHESSQSQMLPDDGKFPCLICGQNGMTEAEMRKHIMMEHVEQDVCCPFCDLNGITANEMNIHVNEAHLADLAKEEDLVDVESGVGVDSKSPYESDTSSTKGSPTKSWSKTSECADKSKLTLDVPSHDGVLRMTPQNVTVTALNSGLSTACGAVQAGISLRRQNGPIVVPDINDNVEPDINSNIPGEFSCPLCQFSTISERDIQTHVNREHVDVLSPCKGGDMEDDGGGHPQCPFCGISLSASTELELHVNTHHVDILSPEKPHCSLTNGHRSVNSWANIVACPVCDQEFDDAAVLQIHVNGHFSAEQTPVMEASDHILAEELERSEEEEHLREQREFHALQALYGMTGSSNYKKQYERNLEKALTKGELTIPEYHMRRQNLKSRDLTGIEDGHSCTKAIMEKLAIFYRIKPPNMVEIHLASHVDHYSVSFGDKGWGCGYRNFQMLLSSLAANTTYSKVLFNGKAQIPSIPKIQRLIEAAWEKGFDQQGCDQLGGSVVDTTKWIGATEIAATLLSLKVKCKLLDFHSPSGPQGTHPKLFEWIKDYFKQQTPYKLPLYLQHQGHSRTVVGIEELKDQTLRLLIFDPSSSKKQMQQFHGIINSNVMRTIRRTVHGLKARQYQIVAVVGVLEEKEYEGHKILKSERVN